MKPSGVLNYLQAFYSQDHRVEGSAVQHVLGEKTDFRVWFASNSFGITDHFDIEVDR